MKKKEEGEKKEEGGIGEGEKTTGQWRTHTALIGPTAEAEIRTTNPLRNTYRVKSYLKSNIQHILASDDFIPFSKHRQV